MVSWVMFLTFTLGNVHVSVQAGPFGTQRECAEHAVKAQRVSYALGASDNKARCKRQETSDAR